MLVRYLSYFFLFILSLHLITASSVELNIDVNENTSTFTYIFFFEEGEKLSSFSFEKPKSSFLISANSSVEEEISYVIAGDYFIFDPELTSNQTITIVFESNSPLVSLVESNYFSTYLNFNFEVSSLDIIYSYPEYPLSIVEASPRNYELNSQGELRWKNVEVTKDLLVLVQYQEASGASKQGDSFEMDLLVFLLVLPVFFFMLLLYFVKKDSSKKEIKDLKQEQPPSQSPSASQEKKLEEEAEFENVEDISESSDSKSLELSQVLTENELLVVSLVSEQEGIIQNDVLDYLPHLTKSNLSKIITKLHAKRFLKRVKVGKVNKIYLGEKSQKE